MLGEYIIEDGVLKEYLGTGGRLVLPDRIHRVGGGPLCSTAYNVLYAGYAADGVRYGPGPFTSCRGLISVEIPEGVREIGSDCFFGCTSLTSVSLPSTLEVIGERAFAGCPALKKVEIGAGNPRFQVRSGLVIRDGTRVEFCPGATKGTCAVPEGIDTIAPWAFAGCRSLKEVQLPDSVTQLGKYAFHACTGLERLRLPSALTELPEGLCSSCRSLRKLNLPDGLTALQDWCLADSGIEEVQLPALVRAIGRGAFCSSALRELELPERLVFLGEQALEDCAALEHLTVRGDPDTAEFIFGTRMPESLRIEGISWSSLEWLQDLQEAGSLARKKDGEQSLKLDEIPVRVRARENQSEDWTDVQVTVRDPERQILPPGGQRSSWVTRADEDVSSIQLHTYRGSRTRVQVPGHIGSAPVWRVCRGALSPMDFHILDDLAARVHITEVRVEDGVREISNAAFWCCRSLRDIWLPASVKIIGHTAFVGCPWVTIHAPRGSFALRYARRMNIPCRTEG